MCGKVARLKKWRKVLMDDIDVRVPMNKNVRMTRVHGWRTRGPWMMHKKKKKPIGKGELVGLIRGPRKAVLKPIERQ